MLCLIYTHDALGHATPRASAYTQIMQNMSAHVITNILCYTSGTLKICPNLKSTVQLAYNTVVTNTDSDCGT